MKQVLKAGLVMLVPGLLLAWILKRASETRDPYDEDFRRYVKRDFVRMKSEEQKWLQ